MARYVTKGLLLSFATLTAFLAAPALGQAACELPSALESKADSAVNSLVRKANGSETKLRKVMAALSELERKYSRNQQAVCLIGYLRTGIQKEIDANSGADDIFKSLDSIAGASEAPSGGSSSSASQTTNSSNTPASSTSSSTQSSPASSSNASCRLVNQVGASTSGSMPRAECVAYCDSRSNSDKRYCEWGGQNVKNYQASSSSSTVGGSNASSSASQSSTPSSTNRFEEYEANWRSKLDPNKTVCDATQTYTAPNSSVGSNYVATGDCSKAQEIVASKCGPDSSSSYKINDVYASWLGSGVMYPNSYNVVGGTPGTYSCENGRILYKCTLRAFKCTMKASTSTPVTWKRCGWLGPTQYHCAGFGPARGEQVSCPVAPPIARKVWTNVSLTLLNPVGTCTTNNEESCTCTYNAATSVSNWQENSWSAAATTSTSSSSSASTSTQTSGSASSSTSSSAGSASVSVTKSSGMWLTLTVNNIGQNAKQCIAPGINAACTPSDQLSQGGGWTYYPSTFSWKFDASVAGIAEPGQYYTLRYSGDNGKTASTSVAVSR